MERLSIACVGALMGSRFLIKASFPYSFYIHRKIPCRVLYLALSSNLHTLKTSNYGKIMHYHQCELLPFRTELLVSTGTALNRIIRMGNR